MTTADDNALVLAAQRGDRQAEAALLARHEGLVRNLANQRRPLPPGIGRDDLLQEGRIGLWKSIRTFDPTKGTKLSSYAHTGIRFAIGKAIDAARRASRGEVADDSGIELDNAPDTTADEAAGRFDSELLAMLPESERRVLEMAYNEGRSQAEVAEIMGVSPSRICQLDRRGRERLLDTVEL